MIEWNAKKVMVEVDSALEGVSRDVAFLVAKTARSKCPWETGELATSITVIKSKYKNGGFIVQAQGPGSAGKYHASFVELGTHKTRNMEKQPFLRPAYKAHKGKANIMFQAALDRL